MLDPGQIIGSIALAVLGIVSHILHEMPFKTPPPTLQPANVTPPSRSRLFAIVEKLAFVSYGVMLSMFAVALQLFGVEDPIVGHLALILLCVFLFIGVLYPILHLGSHRLKIAGTIVAMVVIVISGLWVDHWFVRKRLEKGKPFTVSDFVEGIGKKYPWLAHAPEAVKPDPGIRPAAPTQAENNHRRPPIKKHRSFVSYLVFNTTSQGPHFVCSYEGVTFARRMACDQISKMANANFMQPTLGSIRGAQQLWEIRQLSAEVLQHYLLVAVKQAAEGFSVNQLKPNDPNVFVDDAVGPMDIPDMASYRLTDVTGTYDKKYLSTWFDPATTEIKLPQNSKLVFDFTSFRTTPGKPNTWWFSIERPNYYKLQWKIDAGSIQPGRLPPGWTTSPPATLVVCYGARVQLDYTIERRLDDPSFVVEDYAQWASELFNNVKSQVSP